nr:MAG TPA: hypothetical protein [Caudoviricetes sp.]
MRCLSLSVGAEEQSVADGTGRPVSIRRRFLFLL